MTVLFSWGQKL